MSGDSGCTDDAGTDGLNPEMQNPFADGVPRRKLLAASGASAGAAVAGCIGGDDGGGEGATPTMFVFNTAEATVSAIDVETNEVIGSAFLGVTASFPANQYGTAIDDEYNVMWLNVDGGVTAVSQENLEVLAEVDTGFGANYPNLTPNAEYLIVASGGSLGMDPDPDDPGDHYYYRIPANPDASAFGELTDEIEMGYTGPCDMTVGPEGEYAFGVDVADESLTVLQVDPFEIATQVDVGESIAADGNVLPFMCTASFDGQYLTVENGEGELGGEGERIGSESLWDISDPESPEELAKITPDDGLPGMPITSEIGPDSERAFLFIPAAQGVGVIDLDAQEYETTLDIGGASLAGGWDPNREQLYVPIQSNDQVAVIDPAVPEVSDTIDVGTAPAGVVGGTVAPEIDQTESIQAQLATLGLPVGSMQPTYCYPDCYCGNLL